MNRRWLWVILGVIAFFGVLFAGAVAGAGITYLALHTRPVQAAIDFGLTPQIEVVSEEGVLIASVVAGSPAEEGGLARGDIILEVDGETINSARDLNAALQSHEPGETVELTVMHGAETRSITIELDEREGQAYLGIRPCGHVQFEAAPFGGQLDGLLTKAPAYLITNIIEESPAAEAGLESGDLIVGIDEDPVSSGQDLREIVQSRQPGDAISLDVQRSGEEETLQLEVTLGENPDEAGQAYLGVEYQTIPALLQPEGGVLPFRRFPGSGDGVAPFFQEPFEGLPFGQKFPTLPDGIDQAVIVSQVTQDSPAEEAGLQPGDAITAVDGESIAGTEAFTDLVRSKDPGDEITLTVYRSGEEEPLQIEVVLGENPDQEGVAYLGVTVGSFIRIEQNNPNLPDRFRFNFEFPWRLEPVEPGPLPEA